MGCLVLFITAVCLIFLPMLCYVTHTVSLGYLWSKHTECPEMTQIRVSWRIENHNIQVQRPKERGPKFGIKTLFHHYYKAELGITYDTSNILSC